MANNNGTTAPATDSCTPPVQTLCCFFINRSAFSSVQNPLIPYNKKECACIHPTQT